MCIDENFDMKLREFLLKLLDDLSDKDRARLHFVLGSEVPRRLRESNEIESTLRIFDYLILNEKIFNSFPVALSACGRADWSKKLKEFEQSSSLSLTDHHEEMIQSLFDDNINTP